MVHITIELDVWKTISCSITLHDCGTDQYVKWMIQCLSMNHSLQNSSEYVSLRLYDLRSVNH